MNERTRAKERVAIPLGPFELREALGRGGMGVVWSGVTRAEGLPVAVKLLTGEWTRNPEVVYAFRNEVRAAARLDHPHVVQVYDYGVVDAEAERASNGVFVVGEPYFAMELAEDGTLASRRGRLPWEAVRQILLCLLDALAHAHARGVVHSDLKPSNVLVGGERPGIKLADFGIAAVIDRPDASRSIGGGTLTYMAPEQFDGRWDEIGPWTDLYALGCLGWALACGAPPFSRENVVQAMAAARPLPVFCPQVAVPAEFHQWLKTLLIRDHDRRPQRAADAAFELLKTPRVTGSSPIAPGPVMNDADTEPLVTIGHMVTLVWPSGSRGETTPPIPARAVTPAEVRLRFELPPVPSTWQRPEVGLAWGALAGAGLGVFGLRPIPFIGRVAERDTLWAALREVCKKRVTRVVCIHGPPGVGKSRLGEWICDWAHEVGAAEIFKASRKRFSDETFERIVDAREDRRAFVLLVDDAHRDLESLRFVGRVLDAEVEGPVLILLIVRDDLRCEIPEADGALRAIEELGSGVLSVPVGLLSSGEHRALVKQMLGLEEELAARVEQRTAGNPQFTIELVGDWVARGFLVPGRDGLRLVSGASFDLPDDVASVWADRWERACTGRTPGERESVELAALLGPNVVEAEWADACAAAGIPRADDFVRELVHRGLVLADVGGQRGSWTFSHALLREAVERGAKTAGRWERLMAAYVQVLRTRDGADALERLGNALLLLGDRDGAVEALLRAGDDYHMSSKFDSVLRVATLCEGEFDALGVDAADLRRARLWGQLARAHGERGDYPKSKHYADRQLSVATSLGDPRSKAEALRSMVRLAWRDGDPDGGETLLEEAERTARASKDDDMLLLLCQDRTRRLNTRSEWARACEVAEQGLAESPGGHPLRAAWIRMQAAIALLALDRLDAAHQQALRARDDCTAIANRSAVASATILLGEVARKRGEMAEATAFYREAFETFKALRYPAMFVAAIDLGLVLLMQGEYRQARTIFVRCLAGLDRTWFGFKITLHAGFVAAAAGLHDLHEFDRHWRALEQKMTDRSQAVEDLAECLEIAAKEMKDDPVRASRCALLARDQWRARGREDKAPAIGQLVRESAGE